MNTKLTLTIEKEVIEKAKAYAKAQQRSLSNLIEEYLKGLTRKEESTEGDVPLTPLVKSLKGALKVGDPENFDYKAMLEEELTNTYLK